MGTTQSESISLAEPLSNPVFSVSMTSFLTKLWAIDTFVLKTHWFARPVHAFASTWLHVDFSVCENVTTRDLGLYENSVHFGFFLANQREWKALSPTEARAKQKKQGTTFKRERELERTRRNVKNS